MYTVELYDPATMTTTNISSKVLQISYSEKLDSETNSFNLACINLGGIKKFKFITVKKNGAPRLSGIILNQKDSSTDKPNLIKSELNCVDWSFLFTIRVVAQIYQNQTIDYIIKDIIDRYIPELTHSNVDSSIINVLNAEFPYIKAMEAVKNTLSNAYGWHWYVDAAKDVHLFEGYEKDGIPLTAANIELDGLDVEYKGDQVANKLWIVGAKQAQAGYIEQYYTGDGQQRYFNLSYEPNYAEVYINGAVKNSKLEQNDDGAQDFLINKKGKVFYIPSYKSPYGSAGAPVTIKFKYRPTVQLIDYYENESNRAEVGLLIEAVTKNKDITDRLSARQYGKAEIKRKSIQKRLIKVPTAADIRVGERCQLSIVKGAWNITGRFLVTSVSGTIDAETQATGYELKSLELEELI